MANAHIRMQPDVESLGILTGAGGAIFCKVNEDASDVDDDCTPSAASITALGTDANHYATFNFAGKGPIRAITALTADGDGNNMLALVSTDGDVVDNAITFNLEEGETIYGSWHGSAFSVYEGNSFMVYFESSSD